MYKYEVHEDGKNVRDIIWTHPDSIKLFNTFLTILIIDLIDNTNKCMLHLLEWNFFKYVNSIICWDSQAIHP